MIRRTLSLTALVGTLVGLYTVVLSGSSWWSPDGSDTDETVDASVDAAASDVPAGPRSQRGVAVVLDDLDRLASASVSSDIALPDPATNLISNPDLETDADRDDLADCWRRLEIGTVDAMFERRSTNDPVTGAVGTVEAATITDPGDGHIKLLTMQQDGCSPRVAPGDQLVMTTRLRATAPVRPALFRMNDQRQWVYWTSGPYLQSDGDWHSSRWALPSLPPGTRRLSIGIELADVGSIELDHLGLVSDTSDRVGADPAAISDATTIVSITFDDGRASQNRALGILDAHGVAATFFVNSGRLGLEGYLSVAEVRQLADAGHEIGGHTVDHARLIALSPDEQRRQICNDRAVLTELGFVADSLAYPLSARDLSAIAAAEDCGYGAARVAGGLDVDHLAAQPFDQIRPYEVPAVESVRDRTTVADLQAAVLAAEDAGGWINLVFHDLCDGCNEFGMAVEDFETFISWVTGRADRGTIVLPFGAVVGRGATGPPVAGPPPTRDVDPDAVLANADFAAVDLRDADVPWCWDTSFSSGIEAAVDVVDDHTDAGRFVRLRIDGAVPSGASARIESARDQGECAPSAQAGVEPVVTLRHRGSGETVIEVYIRDPSGSWRFHSRSDALGQRTDWHRQVWVAPPLPDDAAALSIRLALRTPGRVDVDDVVVRLAPRPGGAATG